MALCLGGNLEQLGYEVLGTVTTGEDAVLQVKECLPDLVLMDIVLSGKMDGIETTQQIHLFSEVPVVYITGRTDIAQWQRAKITEPFGYILKPFELRELDVVIAAAFYKYRKEQDFKELQRQLLQSEKLAAIGQLTAGVAHEINNPVGYISNNMELLRQYVSKYTSVFRIVEYLKRTTEQGDIQKAKLIVHEIARFEKEIDFNYIINDTDKLLEHTQRGIDKIQKIVVGLRTFAHRDNEIMEPTDIEGVLESVMTIVYNEIKYKARIKKEFNKIPLIKCNPQEIGQVFINLLINASQAISTNGQITIRTYSDNNHVKVAISDTGSGIAPEDMKKIFTPFFTTKEKGKGTGLGLSISYDIIKRHNGDILVESELNKGTTFTVLLPF